MEKQQKTAEICLETVEPVNTTTPVVAEEKDVTCNWQGETLNVGDTRCKDHIEYVCGSNGQMRKSGKTC